MKISIITVTYNAEATIERTMQSVANQSYHDYEHIIMDGASKDLTVEIAKKYDAIIVSEPDKGLYDAMNKAMKLATGDFVCFLNAGDKLHSNETLSHIAAASSNDVAVIYGDTDIVDDEGRFIRNRRLTPPEHLTWKSFRNGMLVCHQSFYINRSIMQQYDLAWRFSADFDWCIRCMKAGEQKGMNNIYVREPLSDYLSEGMTTANQKASLRERFRIMAKHYGLLPTIAQHIWFILRVFVKK